jgi:hypothetical protein
MGICTFGNNIENKCVIINEIQDEKNKIIYPKYEFYYLIYSNIN